MSSMSRNPHPLKSVLSLIVCEIENNWVTLSLPYCTTYEFLPVLNLNLNSKFLNFEFMNMKLPKTHQRSSSCYKHLSLHSRETFGSCVLGSGLTTDSGSPRRQAVRFLDSYQNTLLDTSGLAVWETSLLRFLGLHSCPHLAPKLMIISQEEAMGHGKRRQVPHI